MTPDEPTNTDVDMEPLERSQQAIDEAREATKKVEEQEDIEAGDAAGFAESTPYADRPSGASDGIDDEALED